MDRYVTGAFIRKLREKKKMTQEELTDMLGETDVTVTIENAE